MVTLTYNKNVYPQRDKWMTNALTLGEWASDGRANIGFILSNTDFSFIVSLKYQSITQLELV